MELVPSKILKMGDHDAFSSSCSYIFSLFLGTRKGGQGGKFLCIKKMAQKDFSPSQGTNI